VFNRLTLAEAAALAIFAVHAFELQLFAVAPSGENTSLMIGKETTFGTAAVATVTHVADDLNYNGSNEMLERPGARRSLGETPGVVGRFVGKGSVSVEPDADTFGSLWLLAMGAEAVTPDAGNPPAGGSATTLNGATAAGVTSFTFTSATGYLSGGGFRIDAGLATQEDFLLASAPAGNVVTTTVASRFAHANTAAIAPATVAQDHTFTIATPKYSYTAQINRGLESYIAFGCKFTGFTLSVSPKGILQAKFNSAYINEAVLGSPVTPTYSTVQPYIFQAVANALSINGATADATCMGFSLQASTGVQTEYPKFGSGRFDSVYPEVLFTVNGSLDMAYETTTQEKNFWGGAAATGPQSTVPRVPIAITIASPDSINAAVPYKLVLTLAAAQITDAPVPIKAKDYLKQTVKFKGYMSAAGANDSLKVLLTNSSSAGSI
jgi:hypothetical protein